MGLLSLNLINRILVLRDTILRDALEFLERLLLAASILFRLPRGSNSSL